MDEKKKSESQWSCILVVVILTFVVAVVAILSIYFLVLRDEGTYEVTAVDSA